MSVRTILGDSIAVIAIRVLGVLFSLAVNVILTRHLGAAGFGTYAFVVSLILVLSVPISVGWATLLLRNVARARSALDWAQVKGQFRGGTILAAVLAAIYGVFLYGLVNVFQVPIIPRDGILLVAVLAVIIFLDQSTGLRLAALRGLNHPIAGQFPELVVKPLVLILCVCVANLVWPKGFQVTHAFYALFIAVAISALLGRALVLRYWPPAYRTAQPAKNLRTSLGTALALSANAGLIIVNTQVGILLLGALAQPADVGVYRIAMQFALLCGFIYAALNFIAVQRFAMLHGAGRYDEIAQTARQLSRLSLLGALPVILVMALFGTEILQGLFGPELLPALTPFFILTVAQVAHATLGLSGTYLVAAGHERLAIRCIVLAFAINIVACWLLIPAYGPIGAAWAATLSGVIWHVSLWITAYRVDGLDISALGLPARHE